jgi:hypothetical protein
MISRIATVNDRELSARENIAHEFYHRHMYETFYWKLKKTWRNDQQDSSTEN